MGEISVNNIDGNTSSTTEQEKEDCYKSSELLLEHIQREYCKEDERARVFESKIPILLTLITLFLGFVVSNDNTEVENQILMINEKFYFIYMLLAVASVACLLGSGGCLVYVICLKEYKRINTVVFSNETLNKSSNGEVAYELILGYKDALTHNISQNDKKGKVYTLGIKLLSVGVLCYIILSVINSFF